MKKGEIIKKKEEFDDIINSTLAKKNLFFIIHSREKKLAKSRYGIAAGTKLGNAVIRNKLKRRVREIINEEKNLFSKDLDYIIIVRKPCIDLKYSETKDKLINLIR